MHSRTAILAVLLVWPLVATGVASAHNGPLVTIAPSQAPAGQQVTVTVTGVPVTTDVELRWSTVGGPLLAVAPAPALRATVTIPAVAADVYYVRAIQDGELVATGVVEVTAASGAAQAPAAPTPAAPADTAPASQEQNAAPPPAAVAKVARPASPAAPAAPGRAPRQQTPTATSRPAPRPVRAPARRSIASAPVSPRTAAGVATVRRAEPSAASRPQVRSRPELRARAVSSGATGRQTPQPPDAILRAAHHAGSSDRELGIGAVLLGLGLVGSLGGLLVVEVRRRRTVARL